MNHVLAYIKTKKKERLFKLISDKTLFNDVKYDLQACVLYKPDHNLDEDSWFKIEQFSKQEFCIPLINTAFDSKDYNNLTGSDFSNISYLVAVQENDFFFQKIYPSMFVVRKIITFGDSAKIEENQQRLVLRELPDAIYIKAEDTLIFKDLIKISSIFKGIDQLYREATDEEVNQFLNTTFIKTINEFDVSKVSKPNRKRIAYISTILNTMPQEEKNKLSDYINGYTGITGLKYDGEKKQFEINSDSELKLLLYGIDQRFYTTVIGQEKRIANSIIPINS